VAADILSSQRARPAKLLESGFSFAHPTIDEAIRAALR
jgi:NAD dependent epimerase/dehydratase family enzyme